MSENPPEHAPVYMQPWVDDVDEEEEGVQKKAQSVVAPAPPSSKCSASSSPPRLPNRRTPHRVLSTSPEEDGHKLPSWLAAQEEEQRAKSTWVDDDAGLQ
jgi:DNA polymerase zeta